MLSVPLATPLIDNAPICLFYSWGGSKERLEKFPRPQGSPASDLFMKGEPRAPSEVWLHSLAHTQPHRASGPTSGSYRSSLSLTTVFWSKTSIWRVLGCIRQVTGAAHRKRLR